MRRGGRAAGTAVVVYDDVALARSRPGPGGCCGTSAIAARAYWTAGSAAWVAAGQPVSTGELPAAAAGDFTAVPGGMPVLDAAGAAVLARSGVLLDARAADRYRGETEPVDRVAGHIPGALSAPTAENVTADGRLCRPAELRARFAALGCLRPSGRRTAACTGRGSAYCGSGVTAAHEVLALELAGIPAALYVGSWSGWVADPGRPVATGPDRG